MAHKHKKGSHFKKTEKEVSSQADRADTSSKSKIQKLEIVLKCDSSGSVEAVTEAISSIKVPDTEIEIISSGVGDIHKSDVLMAETGSKLIAGFQVGILPKMDEMLREYGVEVRLYNVIYELIEDIKNIAQIMSPHASEEQVIGSARIIALFKSSRKGIIIGCEVLKGHLAVGQRFRVISAAGPVYSGRIESMKIEQEVVQKASVGQQVGIKIRDFKKAHIGDIVESFRSSHAKDERHWRPKGIIIRKF